MPYIIDGHNLIPKIPGLTLQDIDDEVQLIEQLQEFCRLQRKKVEVYFDNAPPGQEKIRGYGAVTAHFVTRGITADDAIGSRLAGLSRQAPNWTVVSSDQAVQSSARYAGAQISSSEQFAGLLVRTLSDRSQEVEDRTDTGLSQDDLSYWLDVFKNDEENE